MSKDEPVIKLLVNPKERGRSPTEIEQLCRALSLDILRRTRDEK